MHELNRHRAVANGRGDAFDRTRRSHPRPRTRRAGSFRAEAAGARKSRIGSLPYPFRPERTFSHPSDFRRAPAGSRARYD